VILDPQWTYSNINVIYTSLKSAFSGLQFCRWQYWPVIIGIVVVAFQIWEIMRNSDKIRTYSSSRSFKVIDLCANRKRIYNFLFVISSNFGRISYCFWDIDAWRIKLENGLFSAPHPCLKPPLLGNPLEFLGETHPTKTRGVELLYGENCIILTSTVFDWSTRVTDGQTDG